MIKYSFIGFNALILLLAGLFFADTLNVSHNLPATLKPGEEVTVEFKIKKDVSIQFAKFQLDIPDGLTVSESESKSGQFSSTSSQVKIIWMQFPNENEVAIKIKLKAKEDASGIKNITGKFQYVTGNEKMAAEIGPHELKISSDNISADNKEKKENPSQNNNFGDNKNDENSNAVKVSRTLSKDSEKGTFKVEIKISKENIKGFAKYTDVIPEGLNAYSGAGSNGATFKFVDGKVSFIWATLPKEEQITASYFLKTNKEFTENPLLTGSFSYLENEQAMKMKSEDVEVAVVEKIVQNNETSNEKKEEINNNINPVSSNSTVTNQNTEDTTAKSVKIEKENISKKEEEKIVSNNESSDKENQKKLIEENKENKNEVTINETKTPEKETTTNNNVTKKPDDAIAGLNFHIQIGAFNNAPGIDYFTRAFGITDKIFTDMNDGLTKYMTGKFSDYKASRDHRENIKSKGVNGAFVTAYNSGKRITVQEALMLLNQKWYK
ncbi:MAG: hypothetical protein ACK5D5_07745 [Bacteroidota bacterium]|jgi:hypothetical protein